MQYSALSALILAAALAATTFGQAEAAASTENAHFPEDLRIAASEWSMRAERTHLENALGFWEKSLVRLPNNVDVLVKLSIGYSLLADGHIRKDNSRELLLLTFQKGIDRALQAMKIASPEFAAEVGTGAKIEDVAHLIPQKGQPAMYWWAVNLGRYASAKDFTTLLYHKASIYGIMQQVLKLDETYYYGAPHRYFGAYYAKAPAWAGGNMSKSKEHFDKALALAPTYLSTKILYAQYYAIKTEDKELFLRLLNSVLATDPALLPELVPEQLLEQGKAQDLMNSMYDYFDEDDDDDDDEEDEDEE